MPEARRRPDVRDSDARSDVELPYGLTADGIVEAIRNLWMGGQREAVFRRPYGGGPTGT